MTDTIAHMLTIMRNGVAVGKESVEFPSSKIKISILKVMEEEGFILGFKEEKYDVKSKTIVNLKYLQKSGSVINGLKRVSTPGLKAHAKSNEIPVYMGGVATSIISTSRGVMTGKSAFNKGLGGEIICYVW